jgi:hypothetical protein
VKPRPAKISRVEVANTSAEKPALERLVAAPDEATSQLRVGEDAAERICQGPSIARPDEESIENVVGTLPNLRHLAPIDSITKQVSTMLSIFRF